MGFHIYTVYMLPNYVRDRGGQVCLGKGCEQRKNLPLVKFVEWGVERGTGQPRKKRNLKKSQQSVKKGKGGRGLTPGAS